MARPKKQTKAKEPVRLRFKELSNGNKSLYLDIYRDGKRSYEFLKLYLVPEKSQTAKVQNEQVMAAANAIKSQRVIEISNNAAGIKVDSTKARILLRDWLKIQLEQKRKKFTPGTVAGQVTFTQIIAEYGDCVPMRNVDKNYCLGFIKFLREEYTIKSRKKKAPERNTDEDTAATGRHLSEAVVNHYFEIFTAALNAAVREGVIGANPVHHIESSDKPHRQESTRTFLTIEEVKKLIATPAKRQDVKQAFLFSCFCGLRWSDISLLTWDNIEENNGRYYANIIMKKTREALYLPLNDQARQFMPAREQGNRSNRVFPTIPKANAQANAILADWAKRAGITKKVTFHVARHTFATTSLTLGADLYTTSKLLGHSNISITQVYAKIVNSKKDAAVDLFNNAFNSIQV